MTEAPTDVETENPMACWMECHTCEDFFCLLHETHVHDCPCPPIEEWAESPYLPPVDGRYFEEVSTARPGMAPSWGALLDRHSWLIRTALLCAWSWRELIEGVGPLGAILAILAVASAITGPTQTPER